MDKYINAPISDEDALDDLSSHSSLLASFVSSTRFSTISTIVFMIAQPTARFHPTLNKNSV